MKKVLMIFGLLVAGLLGVMAYLHYEGAPSEWDRKREAHALWKQTAVEPSMTRDEEFSDRLMVPEGMQEGDLRMPASKNKEK